jgi:TFIIF-interacting CTD phosphatase-like protein
MNYYVDIGATISRMFYRDSCTRVDGQYYVKDLKTVRADLSKVILIDNSPVAYSMNPENALPCSTWEGNPDDTELLSLLPILAAIQGSTKDVRSVLSLRLFNSRGRKNINNDNMKRQYQHSDSFVHVFDEFNK